MNSLLRRNVAGLCSRRLRPSLNSAILPSTIQLHRYRYPQTLLFSSSSKARVHLTTPLREAQATSEPGFKEDPELYHGPLSTTFRRLKIFSLASLGLSSTLAPFMFLVESNLPAYARLALAGIALGTSGLSTTLVAWCAKPYVITMRRFYPDGKGAAEELEMTTTNLILRPRITKVYDPSFLVETRRPLAKWELAQQITLTPSRTAVAGTNVHPVTGHEETVAETRNERGEVIGRWIVKWGENGVGTCHQVGHVVRHFNVHEELLK